MAAIVRALQNSVKSPTLLANGKHIRTISTSKKNRETASIAETNEKSESATSITESKKNWVSYGFDFKSEEADKNAMHSAFFFGITVCLVFGGFFFTYCPDIRLKDWAQREAYLELRRREELGLPLIDPNLIDPEKVVLPSDEELGDTEIII